MSCFRVIIKYKKSCSFLFSAGQLNEAVQERADPVENQEVGGVGLSEIEHFVL